MDLQEETGTSKLSFLLVTAVVLKLSSRCSNRGRLVLHEFEPLTAGAGKGLEGPVLSVLQLL